MNLIAEKPKLKNNINNVNATFSLVSSFLSFIEASLMNHENSNQSSVNHGLLRKNATKCYLQIMKLKTLCNIYTF